MVKKKGKSKRITLKDKYKIQRRIKQTHKKRSKQNKKDLLAGKVIQKKKDPGIPNSWPFKQDLLKEIQQSRERQQQLQQESKDKRRSGLNALREHQEQGGTARTVQELRDLEQGVNKPQEEALKNYDMNDGDSNKNDDTMGDGQHSKMTHLRELKKVVDSADVILQVLDARDPIGTRIHKSIEDAILSRPDKRMVLILNKIDLVPKDALIEWLSVLRRSFPTVAFKATDDKKNSTNDSMSVETKSSAKIIGADSTVNILRSYAKMGRGEKKKSKKPIVVGIIGYPDVGKSSIINALKRVAKCGDSTSTQGIVLHKKVRLLENPGIVLDDDVALLGKCIDVDIVEDHVIATKTLLQRCNHSTLMMSYNISSFPEGDVTKFLALIAKSKGSVKGGKPGKIASSRAALREWKNISYYTPVQKDLYCSKVSKGSEEFDMSQYDNHAMNNLEDDTDEMDYVQLNGSNIAKNDVGDSTIAAETVGVLTGKTENDEDSEMSENHDSDEENSTKRLSMTAIADAEDYNFKAFD